MNLRAFLEVFVIKFFTSSFISLSILLLTALAFADSGQVCGQVKSYSRGLPGHFATVNLQDGTSLPISFGLSSGETTIATSMAANLTVCFRESRNDVGSYYEIATISK